MKSRLSVDDLMERVEDITTCDVCEQRPSLEKEGANENLYCILLHEVESHEDTCELTLDIDLKEVKVEAEACKSSAFIILRQT
jgi:hypothetical protein